MVSYYGLTLQNLNQQWCWDPCFWGRKGQLLRWVPLKESTTLRCKSFLSLSLSLCFLFSKFFLSADMWKWRPDFCPWSTQKDAIILNIFLTIKGISWKLLLMVVDIRGFLCFSSSLSNRWGIFKKFMENMNCEKLRKGFKTFCSKINIFQFHFNFLQYCHKHTYSPHIV